MNLYEAYNILIEDITKQQIANEFLKVKNNKQTEQEMIKRTTQNPAIYDQENRDGNNKPKMSFKNFNGSFSSYEQQVIDYIKILDNSFSDDDIKTYHNLWINFLTSIRNRMETVDDSVRQIHKQSLESIKNNFVKMYVAFANLTASIDQFTAQMQLNDERRQKEHEELIKRIDKQQTYLMGEIKKASSSRTTAFDRNRGAL